ncbi:MAG: hypothetical protein JWL81_728 [Verrucomicrobiales bacterium]|nr:hypothetical protein [Verrucomicrobiales bacterium]
MQVSILSAQRSLTSSGSEGHNFEVSMDKVFHGLFVTVTAAIQNSFPTQIRHMLIHAGRWWRRAGTLNAWEPSTAW